MPHYGKYRDRLWILLLLLFSPLPGRAEPVVKAGAYEIHLQTVARLLDLTPSDKPAPATSLTLSLQAPPEALGKLLEAAQEPQAIDDLGNVLTLQEIRYPEDKQPGPEGNTLQILLSPADRAATRLKQFTAHLVCFDKKESLHLDFLSVAGEKLAGQDLDYLSIHPELVGPREVTKGKGKVYLVKVEVQFPAQPPDPSVSWRNEQVELIDAEGRPQSALSTSRSFKYDDKGQMLVMVMTAAFPLPAKSPRGLRYRVERLQGVQVFDYVFNNLPLP
jgi:hypothetical protein